MNVLDRPVTALLPSTRAPAAGTELPQQVASRALAQASALLIWGWLLTAPVVIGVGVGRFDVPGYLAVLTAMAVAAGACTGLVMRRPDLLLPVTVVGLVVVAGGIAAFDVLAPIAGMPSNPSVSLMGTACLVAGLVLRPAAAAGTALALALWQSWWDLGPPWTAPVSGYLEMLLTAAVTVVGARFVAVSLVRSSLQVAALVNRLLDERRAEQARRIRQSSLAAARSDLHDTVLTTLSGLGAGWLATADPATLRAEFQRDARLLADLEDEGDGLVDLAEGVRALAASPLLEQLTVDVCTAGTPRAPAVVADAFLLATREALVNVLKHAGTGAAVVALAADDDGLRVTVRDDGAGFDPTRSAPGMGVPGIAARMAGAGGWGLVDSAPGRGTTVVLGHAGTPAEHGAVPPLWSIEGPRRGALGLIVVAGVAEALSFGIQAGNYPDVRPHLAMLVLALAVDGLVVATLVRHRRLPGWLSAVLIVRIAVVLLVTGLALPGCASMGYQHFSGGGEFFTCIAITLLRPRREAVVGLAAYAGAWLVLAVPLYADGETCGVTAAANSAIALGLVVAAMTLVGALRRHAAIAGEVLAAEESLAAAERARQVRAEERRRLLPVVRDIVTDTLTGLADGRLDPADPAARRLCRRDARLLRTFLTQAGDGDDLIADLFARAVRLRTEGVDLAVRGSLPRDSTRPEQRAAVLATVDTCLATVGEAGWAGEGLITVLRAGDDVLTTVVLRDLPPEVTGGAVRLALLDAVPTAATLDRAEVTDGDLWVTCRIALAHDPTGDLA